MKMTQLNGADPAGSETGFLTIKNLADEFAESVLNWINISQVKKNGHFFFSFTLFKHAAGGSSGLEMYAPVLRIPNIHLSIASIYFEGDTERNYNLRRAVALKAKHERAILANRKLSSEPNKELSAPNQDDAADSCTVNKPEDEATVWQESASWFREGGLIPIKANYEGEIRRFNVAAAEFDFPALSTRITTAFEVVPGTKLKFTYCDEDGDWITFDSTQDLREAVSVPNQLLRINVRQLGSSQQCLTSAAPTPMPTNATQPELSQVPFEFQAALRRLSDMGFTDEASNRAALARSKGSIDDALASLVPSW